MLQVPRCVCVLFSSGLLLSSSLCGRAPNRAATKRFSGYRKVSDSLYACAFYRVATKFLAARAGTGFSLCVRAFSTGLLQSFSLCGRALNRAATKRFSGLCKVSVSLCVCAFFYRVATMSLAAGLMRSSSGYYKFLVVCACFLCVYAFSIGLLQSFSLPSCDGPDLAQSSRWILTPTYNP